MAMGRQHFELIAEAIRTTNLDGLARSWTGPVDARPCL